MTDMVLAVQVGIAHALSGKPFEHPDMGDIASPFEKVLEEAKRESERGVIMRKADGSVSLRL